MQWIGAGIMSLIISLIGGVYYIAGKAWEVFMLLANVEVISPDTYQELLNNIYLILGIVMLFVIAIFLLQSMVNPDNQKTGTSQIGKLVINFITSIVIIALLPTIFTFAFDVQSSILTSNVIGKLFGYDTLSSTNSSDDTCTNDTIKTQAYSLVNGVWTAFFNINEDYCVAAGYTDMDDCQANIESDSKFYLNGTKKKWTLAETIANVDNTGNFLKYTNFSKNIVKDDSEIDFHGIMSLVGGVLMCYVAVSFCFDMALRMIKLIFYQVIAPIPILLRIAPGNNMSSVFNNWIKATLSCYFEVFVRIFVVYAALYVVQIIEDIELFKSVECAGWFVVLLAKAFVWMGISMFMKQAPKLLGEVTGIKSDGMKLGIRDKFRDGMALTTAAASFVGGTVANNPIGGLRAAGSGWRNSDLRGIGAERKRHEDWQEARANGATLFDRFREQGRNFMGLPSGVDYQNQQMDAGTDPRDGSDINSNNDTNTEIILRDDQGREIGRIHVGEYVHMNTETQQNIEMTKKANAARLSELGEQIRHYTDASSSNNQLLSIIKEMEEKAEKPVYSGDSDLEYTITVGGELHTGNLAVLKALQEKRKNSGATDAEVADFERAIGTVEHDAKRDYIRGVLSGRYSNDDITGFYNQLRNLYSYGVMQSSPGVSDTSISSTGGSFVEEVKDNAESYNRRFQADVQVYQNLQSGVQAQDTALDRLTQQHNETKEAIKSGNRYRAAQSTKNYVDSTRNHGNDNH